MLSTNSKPKTNGDDRARLTERLARLKKQFEWGDISERDYVKSRDEIKSKLAHTRQPEMTSIINAAEVIQNMANVWAIATKEEKRDLWRSIMDEVICDPSQRRLVALKPKLSLRLLLRQVGELQEDGAIFKIV